MFFSCWGWDRIGWAVTSMFIADCWICHCFHQHEDVAILRSFIMIYDYSPDSPSSTNTYLVYFVKKNAGFLRSEYSICMIVSEKFEFDCPAVRFGIGMSSFPKSLQMLEEALKDIRSKAEMSG